jgi:cell division septum initiation protein DivIVA
VANREDIKEDEISINISEMSSLEDILAKLDEVVRGARSMPLSASAIIPRAEVLAMVEELKQRLPEELARARSLLRDADGVVDRGRLEGEKVVERAKHEREKLISKTEIVQAAAREADRLVATAEAQAQRIRSEAEAYVEGKLANFEVVLQKTLSAVERGRARLSGNLERDSLGEAAGEPDQELEE